MPCDCPTIEASIEYTIAAVDVDNAQIASWEAQLATDEGNLEELEYEYTNCGCGGGSSSSSSSSSSGYGATLARPPISDALKDRMKAETEALRKAHIDLLLEERRKAKP